MAKKKNLKKKKERKKEEGQAVYLNGHIVNRTKFTPLAHRPR